MTSIPRASVRAAAKARRRHGFLALFLRLTGLRRQRAQLLRLDDHSLRDIGLSRSDALNEAARPIWDVPTHWRN